ncbi:MAG: S8 family serine peptidase [Planctomycetota bacterium]
MSHLALLLALALPTSVSEDPVEPAVYEELAQSPDGTAAVVVMLRGVETTAADLAAHQEAVAERQELVLAALAPADLDLGYRYANVAALSGRVTAGGVAVLAAHPDVLAVGVNGRGGIQLAESVPFIGADLVHGTGVSGAGVTVAVLDTGIDTDHPDLADNIAPGAMHFLDDGWTVGAGAEDVHGHGTHVAGIVTSKGVESAVGVAPDADVLAIQVLADDGTGWITDWAAGVDHVVSVAPDYANLCAINLSLGTFVLYGACPCDDEDSATMLLAASIQAAKDAGITSFAASGNFGSCGSMSSPACTSAAVAVAAVYDAPEGLVDHGVCVDDPTAANQVVCFSNRSACNQLAAPGYLIESAAVGGGVVAFSGTSMAAPHVAGVAALMNEVSASLTPDVVVALLSGGADPADDPCGAGPPPLTVSAWNAVNAITPPLELVQVGLPANPETFGVGVTSAPVLDKVWDPWIDHTTFATDAVADFVAVSLVLTNIPTPFGTVLCGLDPLLVVLSPGPGTPFHIPIPLESAYAGARLVTQGGSLGADGSIALANGLEIVIGTHAE